MSKSHTGHHQTEFIAPFSRLLLSFFASDTVKSTEHILSRSRAFYGIIDIKKGALFKRSEPFRYGDHYILLDLYYKSYI